jgi:hypothetical protein
MPRFIETIVWSVFYLAFLVFVLTAHASSPMYNAIFIDRTATDWLPDATRRYAPPDAISGQQVSPYFANGWWRPEADRRWGKGGRNTIVVQPTRSLPEGSRVKGRIGALLGGSRKNQIIIIEVNGVEVDRLDFVANKSGENIKMFDARLPAAIAEGERVEIAFVVPGATSLFLLHGGDDHRPLGVCFFELALVPPG